MTIYLRYAKVTLIVDATCSYCARSLVCGKFYLFRTVKAMCNSFLLNWNPSLVILSSFSSMVYANDNFKFIGVEAELQVCMLFIVQYVITSSLWFSISLQVVYGSKGLSSMLMRRHKFMWNLCLRHFCDVTLSPWRSDASPSLMSYLRSLGTSLLKNIWFWV